MNCDRVERLLTDDLTALEMAGVEDHLCRCRSCRNLYLHLESLTGLENDLRQLSVAPQDFSGRVVNRAIRRNSPWVPITAVAAVIVLALLLTGWEDFSFFQPHDPDLAVSDNPSFDQQFAPVHADESNEIRQPYVDLVVFDSEGKPHIVRVPSTITIQRTSVPRRDYLTYASH